VADGTTERACYLAGRAKSQSLDEGQVREALPQPGRDVSSPSLRQTEPILKLALDPTAVDVQHLENLEHFVPWQVFLVRPAEDFQILPPSLEPLDDSHEQGRGLEFFLQKAVIVMVEFDPKCPAFQVFEPPRS
jgi:hypothetical protein